MWFQQLFYTSPTLENSVYSDTVLISHVCNLRLDFKLFFSDFWETRCYFRACFCVCSLWIYLQSLVLPKSPPRQGKMVPYSVCVCLQNSPAMCHLLLSAQSNNDNGSSFEAKPHLLEPYCGGCKELWIQYHDSCLLLMPCVFLLQWFKGDLQM